jgi:hypothetical protein
MADQREPVVGKRTRDVMSAEEAATQAELDAEVARRAKLKEGLRVVLLERTAVSTALDVKLPRDMHGEWVRNDPLRIQDMIEKNFRIDKEFAPKQALHNANSDGSAVVGDLIFMTCSKENKEIIDEIRKEEYDQRHGKPGKSNQTQIEERGFAAEQKTLIGTHIGSTAESIAHPVAIDTTKKD